MLADDTSSDVMADVLQQVIWHFNDELGPARRNDNAFVYPANRAEQDFSSGIAGGRAVELFPANAQEAQDRQALQVPGPSALTWLVPGLAALVFMRRRVPPHA